MYLSPVINIDEVISLAFVILLLPINIITLLLWVIVLSKESNRLRKKAKYSTLSPYNEDASLQALNSKVEYRKSLFLFAIVLSELVFHILTAKGSIDLLIKRTPALFHQNEINSTDNITNMVNNTQIHRQEYHSRHFRLKIPMLSFIIPLVITFSLVYTLMSYYVMVTKKSLNYNTSLKSVNLSREQKRLLLISFGACIILLLLLLSPELYILYEVLECCVLVIQVTLIINYKSELVRVINWKIADTKIVFGTNHHLFKSYTKTLRNFKWCISIFIILITSICAFVLTQCFKLIIAYTYRDVCSIPGTCSYTMSSVYHYIMGIMHVFEQIPLIASFIIMSLLNISTIPCLLSKVNLRCRFS